MGAIDFRCVVAWMFQVWAEEARQYYPRTLRIPFGKTHVDFYGRCRECVEAELQRILKKPWREVWESLAVFEEMNAPYETALRMFLHEEKNRYHYYVL